MSESFFWNIKMLVLRPAEISFCLTNGLLARSVRVCLARARLGHSKTDDRMHADDRRFVLDLLRVLDRGLDSLEIVAVLDLRDVPPRRLKSHRSVFGKRQIGRTVDRYLVVVVEINEISELEMTGERTGLVTNALHKIAVRTDAVDKIINDRKASFVKSCRKMRLRDTHPDAVCKTLTERPRRHLDTRC